MKKMFLVFMFFVPVLLFAAVGESRISIAPDGTELKWENGNWDFFIMHKTLIDRVTGEANVINGTDSTETNPQGDTFLESSTYTLTSEHIPQDADIDRAFLVWLSTQDPDDLAGPTDNSVKLTFTNATDPEITLTQEVTASFQGDLASTQQGNFEYEAINMPASSMNIGATGVYTYRVEVSDFMKEIIKMGKDKGISSGEALYGDYTVSGMEGSNHRNYLETSGLVGGWFMPFVYKSKHINAKNIYFYHSLAAYRFETKDLTVSGFELPDEAIIKLGLVVFEGDPGLAMAVDNISYQSAAPEGLSVSGQSDPDNYAPLFNDCNPPKTQTSSGQAFSYVEMYNSISSVFSWSNPSKYWCVGNQNQLWPMDETNPLEYAMDADIMMVDASQNGPFYGRFNEGETSFNIKIGANQDQVYTNMLIVSVDTQKDWSDSDTDTDISDTADTEADTDSADTSTDTDSSDTNSAEPTDPTDPADSGTDSDTSDSGTEKGNTGELGGECYPNETCNEGLVCNIQKNICMEKGKVSDGCSLLTVD